MQRLPHLALIAAPLALIVVAAAVWLHAPSRAAEPVGSELDLKPYTLTFDEEFKDLSISAHGPDTRWIAHTPWNGDFGDAAFSDPGPDTPFSLMTPHGLKITASKGPDGKWRSGLISSRDKDGPDGHGFAQKFGYFEMRSKFPSGNGVWPAFWLIGVDKSKVASEIDVVEYYGVGPSNYHVTAHLWSHGRDDDRAKMLDAPSGSLENQFNDFGVLIEPETTTFYLNHKATWSIPTPPEYRQPMYLLADLALGGGWPIDKLQSPKVMEIEWIRAYQAPSPPSSASKQG